MIAKKNISNNFVIFLFLHLVIWTLVPALSNVNLPLDTIEALAWGSNLDWGFNKHPPLSAFVVEIFYQIFGNQDWAYYFLSQIFVFKTYQVCHTLRPTQAGLIFYWDFLIVYKNCSVKYFQWGINKISKTFYWGFSSYFF